MPVPEFAGDQHGCLARRHLLGELDHARHGIVAINQFAAVVGDGREHGSDQFRIGRQRDVFLGAGLDGGDGGASVGRSAARDYRRMDVLGFEPAHQLADIDGDVDHEQIGAAAGAQDGERLGVAGGVRDGSALVHRQLGRCRQLAVECADDQ